MLNDVLFVTKVADQYGCTLNLGSFGGTNYTIDLEPIVVDKDGIYICYKDAAFGLFLEIPICNHGIVNKNCSPLGFDVASISNNLTPVLAVQALRLQASPISIGTYTTFYNTNANSDANGAVTLTLTILYDTGDACPSPNGASTRSTNVVIKCGTIDSQLLTTTNNCVYTFTITTTDQSICAILLPGKK